MTQQVFGAVTAKRAKLFAQSAQYEYQDSSVRIPSADELRSILANAGVQKHTWEWVTDGENLVLLNVKTLKVQFAPTGGEYPFRLVRGPKE